jgi:multiple sugar transport system permease protein
MVRRALARATPWLLLVVPLLLLFLFLLLPYLLTFYYSTTGATIGRLSNVPFVGLANFQAVLASRNPPFPGVLLVTAAFTAGTLIGSLVLGTALALTLYTVPAGRRSALLAVYLIPWVIAGVVIGYTWKLMYDPEIGLANTLLGAVGIAPISWLSDQATSIVALVAANVWAGYGIVLLVISAALANVPPNLILAGQVDGASVARIVRRIILPAIRPAFLLAALVALVGGLNTFDLIYAMTKGGPLYQTETMALEMYRLTALKGSVGQGAAVTVILFTLSLLLAIVYVVLWRREARKWT